MAVDARLVLDAGINDHCRIDEELNAHAKIDEELNGQREPRSKETTHKFVQHTGRAQNCYQD
eukprot:1399288-Lingulodinium_polyedra.AAC.1